MSKDKLPYICPDHPEAKIRKEWLSTMYIFNGYPRGEPSKHDFHYYCNECDRELAESEDRDE